MNLPNCRVIPTNGLPQTNLSTMYLQLEIKYEVGYDVCLFQYLQKLKLDPQTYKDIRSLIKPYNDAKHHVNHRKDTHLFLVEEALLYYAATRKISISLMSCTHMYTPRETWSVSLND